MNPLQQVRIEKEDMEPQPIILSKPIFLSMCCGPHSAGEIAGRRATSLQARQVPAEKFRPLFLQLLG